MTPERRAEIVRFLRGGLEDCATSTVRRYCDDAESIINELLDEIDRLHAEYWIAPRPLTPDEIAYGMKLAAEHPTS